MRSAATDARRADRIGGGAASKVAALTSTRVLISAAHVLIAAGFFLPWLGGPFGARETLSGLDVVRLGESAAALDPAIASGARVLAFAAAAIPGTAAAGLAAAWAAPRFGWRLSLAMRLSTWLATATGLGGLVVLVAVALGARSSEGVDGPLFGLYVMAAGLLLALVCLVARR
jgi:hypothetical protein